MPLTTEGRKVLKNMKKQYGAKKGQEVFYASINKGKKASKQWHEKKNKGKKASKQWHEKKNKGKK